MQAADRFAIVVIQQNPKIALSITLNNSLGIDHRPNQSTNDVVSLKLFQCCQDFVV